MTESHSQKIAENIAAYTAGNIFSRLFELLTVFLLARYLGVADFGEFSFAFAYVGLFSVFLDWGINLILVREMAKSPDRGASLYGSGIALKLSLAAAGTLAAAGSILLFNYPPQLKVLTVIVSLNLFLSFRIPSFNDIFEVPLIVALKLKYSALAAAANRVLTFLGVVAAILLKAPLWVVILIYTAVAIPSVLIQVHFSGRVVRPAFRVNKADWMFLFRQGLPLGLGGIFAVIFTRFDFFLLSQFRTLKEVGIYSAARRITEPLELIPSALALSILPIMSRFFVRGKEDVIRIYRRSLLYLLLVAIPLVVFLMSFSRPIVVLLFGKGFQDAERALVVLSLYVPCVFIWYLGSALFIAIHKQGTNSLIWGTAIVLYLVGDLILIPRQGFMGASSIRLVTGICLTVLSIWFVRRHLGRIDLGFLVRLGLLTLPLAAACRLVLASHPLLSFVVFVAFFAAGIWVLRIINGEDVRFVKETMLRVLKRR